MILERVIDMNKTFKRIARDIVRGILREVIRDVCNKRY